jgi:hypothetical protein
MGFGRLGFTSALGLGGFPLGVRVALDIEKLYNWCSVTEFKDSNKFF